MTDLKALIRLLFITPEKTSLTGLTEYKGMWDLKFQSPDDNHVTGNRNKLNINWRGLENHTRQGLLKHCQSGTVQILWKDGTER